MLLLNICVLVGAVLTPPSLRWLYSTCIALLCLYQIIRKDWLGLFIVTISLVALIGGNSWREWPKLEINEGSYWDVEYRCLHLSDAFEDLSVLVKSAQGMQRAALCRAKSSHQVIPVTLHYAQLFGDYREHLAYVKGVDALFYLPRQAEQQKEPLSLDRYSSWRFAYSIIKGDRSQWDERDRWLINYLGITHLFVVSGLHVGFVCMLALLLSRLVWRYVKVLHRVAQRRTWLDWLMAVPSSFAYAYWSGLGEPAIRAALMALLFLTIKAVNHRVSLFHVLGVCAWLMLLQWPGRALDPSFWLSFSFVLLIALLLVRVNTRGRMLWMQCLMSLFALLLTLGWQPSLSVLTVLVNLILIPFVAFIWFPGALTSLLECTWFGTTYLYSVFDHVLLWFYQWIEVFLYNTMAIIPRHDVTVWFKALLIGLAFWCVFWLPSRRALAALGLLCIGATVLPLSENWNVQWYQDRGQVVYWQQDQGREKWFSTPGLLAMGSLNVALNPSKKALAEQALKEDWHVAVMDDVKHADLLRAMQVKVLTMRAGERISFYHKASRWQVHSSDCYQILNLVKTVACEHAEWLESVLN